MWYLINRSLTAALGMSDLTSSACRSFACGHGRSCLEFPFLLQKTDSVEKVSFPFMFSLLMGSVECFHLHCVFVWHPWGGCLCSPWG